MSFIKCGVSVLVRFRHKGNFINPMLRFCSTKPENLKEKEVYYGALGPQIKGIKVFSLTTSLAGILAQPVLYHKITLVGGGMPLTIALGSFIGFFSFVTPFLLHTITKKYVTRIVYNEKDDNYTATTFTFFLRPNHITFRPEDVVVPDITGMFTTFLVKGHPLFVDLRLFPDVKHYSRIMGYDKPIDFKFEDDIENSDSTTKK